MKIALVTAYFYPTSSGGTEKYVLNLAKELSQQQHEVHVITAGSAYQEDTFEGIKVFYLPEELSFNSEILSGTKAASNLKEFEDLLNNNKYDLIHFHSLTPAFNTFHIAAAKKMNAEIHFTAHVPGITCIHGDLMLFGKKACDGLILKNRCTACYISKKGPNKILSEIIGKSILTINEPKSIATAVTNKRSDLEILNRLCSSIYLFTHWQRDIFLKNGFKKEKLVLTNQLLGKKLIPQPTPNKLIKRIGFVGRISQEKGLDVLIRSFKLSKRNDLQLHIAGIVNDQKYFEKLKAITSTDSNIFWQINLTSEKINEFYKKIDLLVIPSVTYETGPFVLFEALEKNIPILANDLGDMKLWRERGFSLKSYSNMVELTHVIKAI